MDYVALLHTAKKNNDKHDIIYYTMKIKETEEEKALVLKANIQKYLAKKAEEKRQEAWKQSPPLDKKSPPLYKQSPPLHKKSPPLKSIECGRVRLPKQPQPVSRKRKTEYSSDSSVSSEEKCNKYPKVENMPMIYIPISSPTINYYGLIKIDVPTKNKNKPRVSPRNKIPGYKVIRHGADPRLTKRNNENRSPADDYGRLENHMPKLPANNRSGNKSYLKELNHSSSTVTSNAPKPQKRIEEDAIKRQERFEQFREKMLKPVLLEGPPFTFPKAQHHVGDVPTKQFAPSHQQPEEFPFIFPMAQPHVEDVPPKQFAPSHQKPKEFQRREQKSYPPGMQHHGNKRKQPVICNENISDGSDKFPSSEVDPFSYGMNEWARAYSNHDDDAIFGFYRKKSPNMITNSMISNSVQQAPEETVTTKNETVEDLDVEHTDEMARKMKSLMLKKIFGRKKKLCK